jgi:hypothetical protein
MGGDKPAAASSSSVAAKDEYPLKEVVYPVKESV